MTVAAVDPSVLAALVTGICALGVAVAAGVLNLRGQRTTAKADEVAAAFEAYDELVRNQREELAAIRIENTRVSKAAQETLEYERRKGRAEIDAYVERAAAELARCEARCRECRDEVGELLAGLAALRAVVHDEIARTAAGEVLDAHPDATTEDAEVESIRRFIRNLPQGDADA